MLEKGRGQLDEALADMARVTDKFPKDRVCWNQVARILFLQGRYEEALKAITLAVSADSKAAFWAAATGLWRSFS